MVTPSQSCTQANGKYLKPETNQESTGCVASTNQYRHSLSTCIFLLGVLSLFHKPEGWQLLRKHTKVHYLRVHGYPLYFQTVDLIRGTSYLHLHKQSLHPRLRSLNLPYVGEKLPSVFLCIKHWLWSWQFFLFSKITAAKEDKVRPRGEKYTHANSSVAQIPLLLPASDQEGRKRARGPSAFCKWSPPCPVIVFHLLEKSSTPN